MSLTEVSGLLATAGINIVLVALFIVSYSVFRKRFGNAKVFFAHFILHRRREGFKGPLSSIINLIPSERWVALAWKTSEEEILRSSGLDAVVFLRVFHFCIRFFTVATVIGVFVLLPLNYLADDFSIDQFTGISHDALNKFTISNIATGSDRLWGHLCALYIISIVAYCLLYMEYKNTNEMRLQYLRTARSHPDQFTVLVRAIPKSKSQTYSEKVEEFFRKFHSHSYLMHYPVYRIGKLETMMLEAERLYQEVEVLRGKPVWERKLSKRGFLGLFSKKTDPLGASFKRLEDLQHGIQDAQSEILRTGKEVPAAFVSFKTRYGAMVVSKSQQSTNPMEWVAEWAPEPRDIHWGSLSIPYSQLWARRLFVALCAFVITVLYVIPMSAMQALVQIDVLQKWFPLLQAITLIPGVKSLITGYLPSLVITILLYVGPSVMLLLTKMEGYVSKSSQERKACGKVFNFLIGNVFFLVTTGSLLSLIDQYFTEPKKIPVRLASQVSQQASVFLSLIFTKGWSGFGTEILQLDALCETFFFKYFLSRQSEGPHIQSIKFYRVLPNLLLFMFIGFMYAILAPLLLPFLLIYFVLGYVIFRNQILNVYEPAYETAGQFWPLVHNRAIISIILMQVACSGMFAAKKKPIVSALTAPLLLATLLFHYYCNLRFYPNFESTSVEITVTKDLDDERDGVREDNFRILETAYLSPSQQALNMKGHEEDYRHPLLSRGEQSMG